MPTGTEEGPVERLEKLEVTRQMDQSKGASSVDKTQKLLEAQMNRRALIGRAAATTAGLSLAAGLSASASAAPTTGIGKLARFQDGGKQIVVNIEDDINSLDPAKGLGTHTLRTVDNMFNSLVETFGDQAEPQPSLATEWSTSEDGIEWTFKLREGVTFHDGTAFDADAVKLSLDRTLFEDNPYYFGPYPFPPFFLGSIKEIQVVDPLTVKFVLKQQDPTFLGNLVWTTSGIVSPESRTCRRRSSDDWIGMGRSSAREP